MRLIHALFKTPSREAMTLFVMGALGGLAFAPFHLWGLFILSCTALLLYLDTKKTPLEAMKILWFWAFGQLCVAFHWVSFSLGVDLNKFFWILPFSLLGLPAFLALFPTLFCGLLWVFIPPGIKRWLFFAGAWGMGEWVRGHWAFGGFAWNLASAIWGHSLPLLQSLAFWGPYGLSVVTVLMASAPSLLFSKHLSLFQKVMTLSCVIVGFFGLMFGGTLRVKPVPVVENCWMRLVQPNVAQKIKWSGEGAPERIQNLFQLSKRPSALPITHILWPESPLPFILQDKSDLRGNILPLKKEQFLLTGMLRATRGQDRAMHVWNSLMIFDQKGRVEGCYDKVHLVPFGEYIPLRSFLSQFVDMSWLKKITAGDRDFAAGAGPCTLEIPGVPPVSPLICFDVAFPGDVTSPEKRPGWLLDITNDAWFEDSWGLYQHFEQGRFRAVEEGLPLVRVANTGVSGVIDPYGQLLVQLPILARFAYDFALPQALAPTLYSRVREIPFWIMVVVLLTAAYGTESVSFFRRKKRRKKL